MRVPTEDQIFEVLDRTWPPAEFRCTDALCLRVGKGGGKRVSAATARRLLSLADVHDGEHEMRALHQTPLFMVKSGDNDTDELLEKAGYEVVDPVTIYAIPAQALAVLQPGPKTVECWPPLAIQKEIWKAGGIGKARLDVMARATCGRTTILGRANNRPAATVYVGAYGEIAMIHALETREPVRRKGAGRTLVHAAALWACRNDATWLALAVTKANVPANSLYQSMGMQEVTSYHYRRSMGERA